MKAVEIAAEWLAPGDWVERKPLTFVFVNDVTFADDGVHVAYGTECERVYWYDEKVQVWA